MTNLPPALVQAINQRTGLDITRPGGTNRAQWQRCPRCATWTLVGLNDDIAAYRVRADPRTLTRSDEALALLTGRQTLHLRVHGGKLQLRRRDAWQIAGNPADTTPVVATHVCGQPLGRPIPRTADDRSTSDACPY